MSSPSRHRATRARRGARRKGLRLQLSFGGLGVALIVALLTMLTLRNGPTATGAAVAHALEVPGATTTVAKHTEAAATVQPVASERLSIARQGDGQGTVVDTSPGGTIHCPPRCENAYPQGTKVVLSAVPKPGDDFDGWHTDGCAGTDHCAVVMSSPVTVSPRFWGSDSEEAASEHPHDADTAGPPSWSDARDAWLVNGNSFARLISASPNP